MMKEDVITKQQIYEKIYDKSLLITCYNNVTQGKKCCMYIKKIILL